MTTNSPNPVDGDVQALIADCEAEIAELEKRLTTWGEAWIPYLQSKLRRQQIALAALTAEPVIYAIQDEEERKNGYMTEFSSSGIAGYVNPEKYGLTELPLCTTPAAQLLRPVELPDEPEEPDCPDWIVDKFSWKCGAGWMRDEVQRLNATTQPVSDGWVKCSDRMPVQHQSNRYVPLNLLLNERTVVQGGFDDSEFWMEGVVIKNVTRWMPLPAAPGGQDD